MHNVKVKSVRALERGLGILDLIRTNGPLSLALIHQHTGLPHATILRSLRTLEEAGWVSSGNSENRYRIGRKLQSTHSVQHASIASLAESVLAELTERVLWPSDIAIRQGTRMAIVQSSRRKAPLCVNRSADGRRPCMLWSALGRAYLAFCGESERQQLLSQLQTSHDPDDRPASVGTWVRRLLSQTRERGYAVREYGYWQDPEDGVEVSSIALPVAVENQVVATMNIVWLAGAHTIADFAKENLPHLREATCVIARAIQNKRA